MSQPSPPKPWERPGAGVEPSPVVPTTPAPTSTTTSSDSPQIPSRPSMIASSTVIPSTSSYSQTNPLSSYSSPYSAYGSSYSSPYSTYNRLGSYSSPYSSYGGYGSSYGGMGMGMGMGMGGYGYGMGMNPMMDPNNTSLVQRVESSTQQTFQLLQSIVQTFTGFSQMLDSTFMATHSSFFAMLGVAEQFGHMRNALGQVFGVFGLVGWLRGWWRGDQSNMTSDFKKFVESGGASAPGQPGRPKPSKKPLVVFLLAVFGLPYLMHKLVKHLTARLPPPSAAGAPGLPANIDPSKLTFARAVFPFASKDPVELALEKGEIVAVLNTQDPMSGVESEWWRGRTRDGREGWFPRAFVETIKPKEVSDAAQTVAPPKVVD